MYLLYIKKEIQKTRQMSSCCLGDRIYSFPCRASYFALGRIWRKDGWIHPFLLIILVQFIIFFKSSYCKIRCQTQQWRPLPILLYLSFFYALHILQPFSYLCYWNLLFHIFVIGSSIFVFLLLEPLFSYFCYWNLFVHILLLEPFCSYFCYWNLFFHIFVIGTSFSIYFLLEPSFLLDWTSSRSIF